MQYNLIGFLSNGIGFYFYKGEAIDMPEHFDRLDVVPQIVVEEVIGSENWSIYSFCYVFDEEYDKLVIGNFNDDTTTVVLNSKTDPTQTSSYAYHLIDAISVEPIDIKFPMASFPSDTTLCPGEELLLAVDSLPGVGYLWQDGTEAASYRIDQAGDYKLVMANGGCTFTKRISVSYEQPLSLGPDTLVCKGEFLELIARHPSGGVLWGDGQRADIRYFYESGTYSVSAPSSPCNPSDSVTVAFVDCPGQPPNVLTPNGDGLNDTFAIDGVRAIDWRLAIYDRWGKEVFQTEAYDNGWGAEGLPAGTYFYTLSNQQIGREIKGSLTVLR
jgi:gliding motility-associated-like protein